MRSFIKGFGYALSGIARAIREERNMRFHLCVAFYVYLLSAFYGFDAIRYCILTVLVCGVFALELVNSAIERAVEKPPQEKWVLAGAAKDMAAGAVLVFCIGCVACAFWLFWNPVVFAQIAAFFSHNFIALVALACSLVLSGWFIFGKEGK